MASPGIDYGMGQTNIDHKTGIRYGVISSHAVSQAWYESAEADYGKPMCSECGNEAIDSSEIPEKYEDADWNKGKDYACINCERTFWSDKAFPDEALGYSYEGEGYILTDCLDSDIMVIKSDYYTHGRFCSPCVPGAVSLPEKPTADHEGVRAYCLGHDWFEEGKAPYRVFRVEDNREVIAEEN